jgi:tRNA pseudouridine38-40 synthase
MQHNSFLTVEYLGSNYYGFQLQDKPGKREITVQQVLERAIRTLFREKISIAYASRTDRGVHAKAQTVNFITERNIPLENIKRALNSFLPCDVRVKQVKEVPLDFHARYCCISKHYRYAIENKKCPSVFTHHFCWYVGSSLNVEAMKRVAKNIVGKKDFSLFAKEPGHYHTCVRNVISLKISRQKGSIIVDIVADGFLRNMVRNIVAFLVKVGEGKLSQAAANNILAKKMPYSNHPAPAKGLYLMKVKYK